MNFVNRLACRVGLHAWGYWYETGNGYQRRYCVGCGKEGIRL